jgi:hypothetical protein
MIDPSTATAPSDTRAEPTPVAAQRPVKFNYLVAQRFLSREQLAAALAEAKERHQSVSRCSSTSTACARATSAPRSACSIDFKQVKVAAIR